MAVNLKAIRNAGVAMLMAGTAAGCAADSQRYSGTNDISLTTQTSVGSDGKTSTTELFCDGEVASAKSEGAQINVVTAPSGNSFYTSKVPEASMQVSSMVSADGTVGPTLIKDRSGQRFDETHILDNSIRKMIRTVRQACAARSPS